MTGEVSPPQSSLKLKKSCAVCAATESLARCSKCHVVAYCGETHQREHFPTHERRCKEIAVPLERCAQEEQTLRNWPEDDKCMPGNPFANRVGHFWGLWETRDYMRARYEVTTKMLSVKSFDAVETALGNYLDMLRLNRSDNMGVRSVIPSLFLRLGQDQNAYDHVKWWAVVSDDYDWGDPDLPFLDLAGSDVFEPIDFVCSKYTDVQSVIDVLLIKVRLALDLGALIDAEDNGNGAPACRSALSLAVPAAERGNRLDVLGPQIASLISRANEENSHIWKGFFVNTKEHLAARPPLIRLGSVEEMQVALQHSYAAWDETPGALDYLKEAFHELEL
ncbi:hypothetical protein HDU86_007749 [Geranomyces michiganensis]|nr:hypothetical protein HDU86_007749 [Geranomyces michiganensis]